MRIDRLEYEVTIAELSSRNESRDGDVVTIIGNHEDHGRTVLRCEAGVFMVRADDLSLIRG
ncbi:hypothetical protein [Lichenifustis flavocetrariae]|uniref:Uncharacterized protein n=1 Tax=Lichenifustis flavocetrariae TaxID=2949735 RepID=A0AA42CNF5_9HYPH|nr:hypothetical protein [Lichenifustis flavocetrariae]MCW6512721.1 hypothetical protein [Lichenifustis flavocetrariae]